MLDHTIASFSASPTYGRDQGVQHLVAWTRAVPFKWVGHMVCIEVIGIPALKCQICDEQSYDLTLLAHVESVLRRYVERRDVRISYLFGQLAAELTTDMLFSGKDKPKSPLFQVIGQSAMSAQGHRGEISCQIACEPSCLASVR